MAILSARVLGPWRAPAALAPIAAGAAGLFGGYGLAALVTDDPVMQFGMASAMGLAAAVLGAQGMQTLLRNRQLHPDGVFLRPFSLDADEVGLVVRTEVAATRIAWAGVLDIQRTPDHALVFLDAASAITIPGHAFAGAAEFNAFCTRLEALWRARAPGRAGGAVR